MRSLHPGAASTFDRSGVIINAGSSHKQSKSPRTRHRHVCGCDLQGCVTLPVGVGVRCVPEVIARLGGGGVRCLWLSPPAGLFRIFHTRVSVVVATSPPALEPTSLTRSTSLVSFLAPWNRLPDFGLREVGKDSNPRTDPPDHLVRDPPASTPPQHGIAYLCRHF